ncbi:uracil-DNA glycosylase [Lichenibacterium ramalinae]|uniref:Type-4 uracil-DNA glycosylase n=1 Tax=Lichenibacterium ramalinae TaxID=2316527 RepID=A0A4Q2RFC4_9HYPH|nr:uracil-DNA glycosylase [Lichenibacterium ramalinae]RYB06396.1 uracil-DNA glycosylase [Lichenibacterium ramalinae]
MTLDAATRDELEALLRWYVDMGVDIAVDAVPHDRFAEAAAARPEPRAAGAAAQPSAAAGLPGLAAPALLGGTAAPSLLGGAAASSLLGGAAAPSLLGGAAALSADLAARSAREAAAGAATLDELKAVLEAFEGCSLKATATRLAFSDGDPGGRVMAVGEAPGAEEDRQGRPFSGRSGQLLDRMLAAIGLDRSQVYVANVVPWRPPGNRTPTPQEVAICRPFITRQIELADPDFLLCLGGPSAQSLLGSKEGIMRLRGRWHDFDSGARVVRAMPMLHPAYLLRQPAHKKLAWADLRALRKAMDAAPP